MTVAVGESTARQLLSEVARLSLDAAKQETFTQRSFADLIEEVHSRGYDYYIARIQCVEPEKDSQSVNTHFSFYDARQLCKYVFEMIISAEGRRIKIKNFRDPISRKEIGEINFFRLRCDSDTPLRAEFVGNHVTFLESSVFRSKLFLNEDALDALSVNFQFKAATTPQYIKNKSMLDLFLIVVMLLLLGVVAIAAIKIGKKQLGSGSTFFTKNIKKPISKLT